MLSKVKNPAAVALGKLGGKKGGLARMALLSPAEKSELGRYAAKIRWENNTQETNATGEEKHISDLYRQVSITAPDITGYPGPPRIYTALLDSGATRSVISEKMAKELGVDVFGKRVTMGGKSYKCARLNVTLEGEECSEQQIDAVISTRIARHASPRGHMLLGHDYFQKANTVLAYTKERGHHVSCISYNKKKRSH